jgi:hypothetical protein
MDAARIDVVMQRVGVTLWRSGMLHPSNVEIAINLALLGLLQKPAA